MSDETRQKNSVQERGKRVKLLKKIIVILTITAVIVPTVLCVILFFEVHTLKKQMTYLYDARVSEIQELDHTNEMLAKEKNTSAKVTEGIQQLNHNDVENSLSENSSQKAMEREIYLTFDDGPSSNTDEILDILQKYNVKATFFVVGKEEEQYKELYQRIVQEGHTLGMHSYSHKYSEIYASVDSYAQDLTKLQDFLFNITGVKSSIVRFPGGSSNQVSKVKMEDLAEYLKSNNITYFDWNVSSGDADSSYISTKNIVDNCLNAITNHKESIILLHDSSDKVTTVEALPIIIESIQKMDDASILPITENTVPIQHLEAKDK